MIRTRLLVLPLLCMTLGCGAYYKSVTVFPAANQVFLTSGDGDIQKPYTPLGQYIYMKEGFRLPVPILGLLKLDDVDPDYVIGTEIASEIRAKGGDGLINMKIDWAAPKNGFFGLFASGGRLFITGTIIKR